MSTVNVTVRANETTKRFTRKLLEAYITVPDVDETSWSRIKLSLAETITIEVTKLLICNVTIPILILLQKAGSEESIQLPFSNTIVLPFTGSVTITNPSNNPITELPATLTYVAI